MKRLIVANWKMNPSTPAQARELVGRIDEYVRQDATIRQHVDMALCPPFVFLEEVAILLEQGMLADVASLGAQDVALSDATAQTGEVGVTQLKSLDVRYVIVGHSERRWKLGESDDMVNGKLRRVLDAQMVPILCVGERTRSGAWQDELSRQLTLSLSGLTATELRRTMIAYEPVWAISTNPEARADDPESAAQSADRILSVLAAPCRAMLYGGSVTPENVKSFLRQPVFNGVLVGGASIDATTFTRLLDVVGHL